MSKVNIGDSVIRNRKRKRVNGNNPSNRPEMKHYNPFNSTEITENFDAITICNGYYATGNPSRGFQSWHPIPMGKPPIGALPTSMVGNEMFLRYLRFKGYIEIKVYPQYKAHYRLKLVRCEGLQLNNVNDYLALYKNIELNSSSLSEMYASFRHNYFKTVRNVNTKKTVRITTICSGLLPSSVAIQTSTLAAGSTTQYGFTSGVPMTVYGGNECIPIDVKVDVNDRIRTNVNYYIVLETDFAIGFGYDGTSSVKHDSVTFASTWNSMPFLFNFFCTGYYTDD